MQDQEHGTEAQGRQHGIAAGEVSSGKAGALQQALHRCVYVAACPTKQTLWLLPSTVKRDQKRQGQAERYYVRRAPALRSGHTAGVCAEGGGGT